MPPTRRAWVYLLASRKNGSLYVGVTTALRTRVWQHQAGIIDGFTKQYRITTLVHFEEFRDVRDAIAREKEIKGWSRGRKIWLIESMNPDWSDLARCWADDGLDPSHGSG